MANILWPSGDPIQSVIVVTSAATLLTTSFGRAFRITAGVAGTVTVTFPDGSTDILTLAVGDNIYPYAIAGFTTGTATITNAAILR